MTTDYFKMNSWKYTFVINIWYCTSKYEMRFNYLSYDTTTVKILCNCKTVHINIVTILGVFFFIKINKQSILKNVIILNTFY